MVAPQWLRRLHCTGEGYNMIAHGHEFECKFEHEPAEPATAIDQGWPAIYTLISAKYKGIEVIGILDPAIVQALEERAE
jgi:hypothetical protein